MEGHQDSCIQPKHSSVGNPIPEMPRKHLQTRNDTSSGHPTYQNKNTNKSHRCMGNMECMVRPTVQKQEMHQAQLKRPNKTTGGERSRSRARRRPNCHLEMHKQLKRQTQTKYQLHTTDRNRNLVCHRRNAYHRSHNILTERIPCNNIGHYTKPKHITQPSGQWPMDRHRRHHGYAILKNQGKHLRNGLSLS